MNKTEIHVKNNHKTAEFNDTIVKLITYESPQNYYKTILKLNLEFKTTKINQKSIALCMYKPFILIR